MNALESLATPIPHVSIVKTVHPENPCINTRNPDICDGWLEIKIDISGKDPFYPHQKQYSYSFYWVTEGSFFQIKSPSDERVITIEQHTQLIDHQVVEEEKVVPRKGRIFGLWFQILLRFPDGIEQVYSYLIQDMQQPRLP